MRSARDTLQSDSRLAARCGVRFPSVPFVNRTTVDGQNTRNVTNTERPGVDPGAGGGSGLGDPGGWGIQGLGDPGAGIQGLGDPGAGGSRGQGVAPDDQGRTDVKFSFLHVSHNFFDFSTAKSQLPDDDAPLKTADHPPPKSQKLLGLGGLTYHPWLRPWKLVFFPQEILWLLSRLSLSGSRGLMSLCKRFRTHSRSLQHKRSVVFSSEFSTKRSF